MGLVGVGLVFCFASLLTVHLAIAMALFARGPRWRALLSLLPPVAPLAIYWALKQRMYILSSLWGVSLLGYAALLTVAYM